MADVTATELAAQGNIAAPRSVLALWSASFTGTLLLLIAPALWNGFPLIFPDTGGYLTRPLEGTLDMGRSAFYGLFLDGGIPFAFWPNVLAQAALIAWLIVLMLRAHGLGGRPWLALGVVALLSVSTSLAWVTAQLMPDILFPAAVLALHLLIFRNDTLSTAERFALAGVVVFAIVSHMAAAGLAVGLVTVLWILGSIAPLSVPKPRLGLAAAAVGVGVLLCPISNWAIAGSFGFTPGGSSFIFGRLAEDGIVSKYLDQHCPDPTLRLCPFKTQFEDIDSDDWLWDPESPFWKLGGWHALAGEEEKIIFATLKDYPLDHLIDASNDIFDQLTSFQTEISMDDNGPTLGAFHDWMPQLVPKLMSARQQSGHIDVAALNRIHVPIAALAMVTLLAVIICHRRLRIPAPLTALGVTVLLSLCINAVICALFAHAVDRYQSRLTPLALLALVFLGLEYWRRTRLGSAADLS
jgi:hypothetical protein